VQPILIDGGELGSEPAVQVVDDLGIALHVPPRVLLEA
jgi:hypothetical protein